MHLDLLTWLDRDSATVPSGLVLKEHTAEVIRDSTGPMMAILFYCYSDRGSG